MASKAAPSSVLDPSSGMSRKAKTGTVVRLKRMFLLNEIRKALNLPAPEFSVLQSRDALLVPHLIVHYGPPGQNSRGKHKDFFGVPQDTEPLDYEVVCDRAIRFLMREFNLEVNDVSYSEKWKLQVDQIYYDKEIEILCATGSHVKQGSIEMEDGWRESLARLETLSKSCGSGCILHEGGKKSNALRVEVRGAPAIQAQIGHALDVVSDDLRALFLEGIKELYTGPQ